MRQSARSSDIYSVPDFLKSVMEKLLEAKILKQPYFDLLQLREFKTL